MSNHERGNGYNSNVIHAPNGIRWDDAQHLLREDGTVVASYIWCDGRQIGFYKDGKVWIYPRMLVIP